MPTYINHNAYKVSLRKPDGTALYLLPNESMQLSAFYDQYRRKGLISLTTKTPLAQNRIRKERVIGTVATLAEELSTPRSKSVARLAVCISGRAIDSHYALNYIRHLRNTFSVDVYAHVWRETGNISFNSWSKCKNDPNNADHLMANLMALGANVLQEDFSTMNQEFSKMHNKIRNAGGNMSRADTGVISMYYSIHKANELRRASGIRYDLVIRMRYDSEPLKELDLAMLNLDAINIPDEEDFAGINDQFALGPPSLMDVYCGVYQNISGLSVKCTHHPELLLKCQLDAHAIPLNRINYRVLIGRNRGTR